MGLREHSAYKEENARLEYTLEYVKKAFSRKLIESDVIGRELDKSKKALNSDSSQAYIDLMISSILEGNVKLKLENLEKAKEKPYFARIDFKEADGAEKEKLYIGKMALLRDEDQETVIIDWRAPVANLYYEGRIGEASYNCPDGEVHGDLSMKRQFGIENGILQNIFDIDITTNDEFLQSYLGANADNRLKDIVSTIQVEQNRVIRADMWKPLIIQGAAGSGKTTIALHRIAYLIYQYEKTFSPENFMIIAPNKLFLNYISEILPELGVDKVRQTTFEDFAMELIDRKFHIKDANEKLINFVDRNAIDEDKERNEMDKKVSSFKASIFFKEILDGYMDRIEKSFIPDEDFVLGNVTLYKSEDIKYLFLNQYNYLSMHRRIGEIKKHLKNRLKAKKDAIREQLQLQCDRNVNYYKSTMEDNEERKKLIIEAIDNKNEAVSNIDRHSQKVVGEFIARISRTDPYDYYKQLLLDKSALRELILENGTCDDHYDDEFIEYLVSNSSDNFTSGLIELEDLAPIIYLKYKIYGIDEKINVRHIVVDEAQDFSVFQFYVIKTIVKDSSFTILGDLCQGIHSYRGTKNWKEVEKYVFEDGRSQLLTLEQSYRTTVEIMNEANKIITKLKDESLVLAKPVIRHGRKVDYIKKDNAFSIAKDIYERIREYGNTGYKSVAIICKTGDECTAFEKYFNDIHKQMNSKEKIKKPMVLTGKEKEYKGGMVIVPSYLAKGLEFDVVFIVDAGADKYKNEELDAKLLYVAMTRALHIMDIYYTQQLTPLL